MAALKNVIGSPRDVQAGAVPIFGAWIFTKDAAVAAKMASITPLLCIALLFHSSVMALEGILFASRKTIWLAWSYVFTTLFFTTLMHYARGWGVGLTGVWVALIGYQLVRLVQFGVGVAAGGLLGGKDDAGEDKVQSAAT